MIVDDTRQTLGRVGVWLGGPSLFGTPIESWRDAARRIEHLGFRSMWGGEAIGGADILVRSSIQLAATSNLVVGTGIANIWTRHAGTMQKGAATLAEAYPNRFILGLGVSQRALVERNGFDYSMPVLKMKAYLDAMDHAEEGSPSPTRVPRLLAALGPAMTRLARDRADGVHPYSAPVEHTRLARAALGPDPLVVVEQTVLLESDADTARRIIRRHRGAGGADTPYDRNLERLGYAPEDLAEGGSDRLIDALVAWGDTTAVAERVQAQLEAGADHVLVRPLAADLPSSLDQLQRLAPALTA